LHERDKGRKNQSPARKDERRNLKTQRLARACGHNDQRMPIFFYQAIYDFLLQAAKRTRLPVFLQ
jgi:hypothetical protein